MSPPGDEKSPTGSCTSESSVEPLGVDICSTPDSVGPTGTTHLCTDGSQTDSGYPSPEGTGYEYNPEKAFKVAASLEVKGQKDGAKKSPTSQRIKDAILGVKKTSKQQGKGKDSDQGGVVVLAKELETRTRIQSDDTQSANILVAAHGAWIRELIRYFVNDLKCSVPGGKHMANRMSYNTGMSKFLVDLSNEIPHIECIYMHKKEHLKDLQVHLRESP